MKRLLLPLALVGLFLVACKPAGPTLDGTWTMGGDAFKSMPGGKTEGTLTFSGDTMELNMAMISDEVGSIKMSAKGTYKLEGETLTPTFNSASADVSGVKDQTIRPMIEASFKEDEVKEQMDKTLKSTVKFISDDEVEMKNVEGTVTLKRK